MKKAKTAHIASGIVTPLLQYSDGQQIDFDDRPLIITNNQDQSAFTAHGAARVDRAGQYAAGARALIGMPRTMTTAQPETQLDFDGEPGRKIAAVLGLSIMVTP
jgi:hypothetical protein